MNVNASARHKSVPGFNVGKGLFDDLNAVYSEIVGMERSVAKRREPGN